MVFLAVITVVNLMLVLAAFLSHPFFGQSFVDNYSGYGIALLPLALTSFMAFHMYFINVGVQLPLLMSETFDFAIFRQLVIHVPASVTHLVQQTLIWIGLVWSTFLMYRLAVQNDPRLRDSLGGMLPHAVLAVVFTLMIQSTMSAYFYGA